MRIAAGIVIALLLGALCRWLRIPLPAPSSLLGALLIACITVGYLAAGYWIDGSAGGETRTGNSPARESVEAD